MKNILWFVLVPILTACSVDSDYEYGFDDYNYQPPHTYYHRHHAHRGYYGHGYHHRQNTIVVPVPTPAIRPFMQTHHHDFPGSSIHGRLRHHRQF